MSRIRTVLTHEDVDPIAGEMLRTAGHEVVTLQSPVQRPDLVAAVMRAPTHALLLRGRPPVDKTVIDAAAPHLRVLSAHGVGYDTVDVAAATASGIPLLVSGNANTRAVAEHAIAMVVMLARGLPGLDAQVKRGDWIPHAYRGREFADTILGLVGFGRIGRETAAMAASLGMRVLAYTTRSIGIDPALAENAGSLENLLSQADVVSLHLPLTPRSRGLVGRAFIAAMKPGASIVNTSRGELVDEEALASALHSGRLAGAALDVLAREPATPACPLLEAPNIVITPHVAAITTRAMQAMAVAAAANIIDYLAGKPIAIDRLVNPEALKDDRGISSAVSAQPISSI